MGWGQNNRELEEMNQFKIKKPASTQTTNMSKNLFRKPSVKACLVTPLRGLIWPYKAINKTLPIRGEIYPIDSTVFSPHRA
jgi:hypothetical protein